MYDRPATFSTATQPKAVAISGDSTVFVLETSSVEAVRSNQKVFDLALKYTPSAIAASGNSVAIGGEVRVFLYFCTDTLLLTYAALDRI